ncbi:MAG: hypothetical protein ACI93R_003005 [Flavobacteriales bacterium]|jgi:hypothetical protein
MTTAAYAKQFALLIRLPNSFTVISNIVAAFVIGSGGINGLENVGFSYASLTTLILASLCFYHGGITLNDCLDINEDRRERPSRPLPSDAISLRFAWTFSIGLMLLGLVFLWPFGSKIVACGGLLLASIVAYNLAPRDNLFGCVLMGLCRALNWLMVLVALGVEAHYWHFCALVGGYVMSLTFLSRDETHATRKWLLYLSATTLSLSAITFLALFYSNTPMMFLKATLFILLLGLALHRLYRLTKAYSPAAIKDTVMFFIIGMIPLDASLLLLAGYPILAGAVLLLLFPSRQLAKKLYVT